MSAKIYDDEEDKATHALKDIEAQPHPGEDMPQDNVEASDE